MLYCSLCFIVNNYKTFGIKTINRMRYLQFLLSFFFATSLFSNYASAKSLQLNCPFTPQIWEAIAPPKTEKSNNLTRKTGSPEFAKGEVIIIRGQVLDNECVPVTEATVSIWQPNSNGVYESEKIPLRDKNFRGSGTSITDNMGYFSFITVYPGKSEERMPHVKFSVMHSDFFPLETQMFFPGNEDDKILKSSVAKNERYLLIARKGNINRKLKAQEYVFNITMEGKNKYKEY